jgi:hypothetical protein
MEVSDRARRQARLVPDLWLGYFELGGMASAAEVESYLRSGIGLSAHEHQVLAQALSERYADLAGPRRPLQRAEAKGTGSASFRGRRLVVRRPSHPGRRY